MNDKKEKSYQIHPKKNWPTFHAKHKKVSELHFMDKINHRWYFLDDIYELM